MSVPKKVLGQIVIKFIEGAEPEIEFTGKLDMLNIQAGVYAMRTQFQLKYLDPIGEELRKNANKAAAEKLAKEAEISKKAEEAKNVKPVAPVATNTESGKV